MANRAVPFVRLAIASLLMSTLAKGALAQADTIVFRSGEPTAIWGGLAAPLSTDARLAWDWAPALLTVANAIGFQTSFKDTISASSPGSVIETVSARGQLSSLQWQGQVDKVTATLDIGGPVAPPTLKVIQSAGGLNWVSPNDDLTNSGGQLALSNLRVDLPTQTVYADVLGDNGVGYLADVRAFSLQDAGTITTSGNAICFMDGPPASRCTPMTLNGSAGTLVPTPDFKNLVTRSLGLLPAGIIAMDTASRWGTLTVTTVPEPTAFIQWSLGLLGMAALSARRKRHSHTARALA